ncbi:uncharacterized protein LOC117344631 [Pecten maximus]|uniref:uncharacterized protein LOC117344631 n=1 Tax=Pecten maximus TaxID=6579 RepID=UPI001457F812|nr:uncharacterized protein LOC117344631 [Pecten maximus]
MLVIPKDYIDMYVCALRVLLLFHVVKSSSESGGLDCPPFDGSKIWIDGKCQCNTTGGCYKPRKYGFCIKMKECPPGYEPNQATNECFPCKREFFSATRDCMPCIPLTQCRENEYELLAGNRSMDTVCEQKMDEKSNTPQTTSDITTQGTVMQDVPEITNDMTVSGKTTKTTLLPPTDYRGSESDHLYIILGLCIPLLVILACAFAVIFHVRRKRQKQRREKDSDKSLANSALLPDSDENGNVSRKSDPPPYTSKDYTPLPPFREGSLSRCTSETDVKRPLPSLDLSEAPPLTFKSADSSFGPIRIPPNDHFELPSDKPA